MISFETPNGKKIEMYVAPNSPHIKIKFCPGGELPEELTGNFTSERDAANAIAKYLAKDSSRSKKPNV